VELKDLKGKPIQKVACIRDEIEYRIKEVISKIEKETKINIVINLRVFKHSKICLK
jgi:3-dehydroquinate dehydratase